MIDVDRMFLRSCLDVKRDSGGGRGGLCLVVVGAEMPMQMYVNEQQKVQKR